MEDEREFFGRWYVRVGWLCGRVALLPIIALLALIGFAFLLLRKVAARVGRKRRLEDEKNARDYT